MILLLEAILSIPMESQGLLNIIWLQGCGWSLPWSCEQERLPDDPISAWNILWSTGTLSKKIQFVICYVYPKLNFSLFNGYRQVQSLHLLGCTWETISNSWGLHLKRFGIHQDDLLFADMFGGVQCDQISNIIRCVCSVASIKWLLGITLAWENRTITINEYQWYVVQVISKINLFL